MTHEIPGRPGISKHAKFMETNIPAQLAEDAEAESPYVSLSQCPAPQENWPRMKSWGQCGSRCGPDTPAVLRDLEKEDLCGTGALVLRGQGNGTVNADTNASIRNLKKLLNTEMERGKMMKGHHRSQFFILEKNVCYTGLRIYYKNIYIIVCSFLYHNSFFLSLYILGIFSYLYI